MTSYTLTKEHGYKAKSHDAPNPPQQTDTDEDTYGFAFKAFVTGICVIVWISNVSNFY